MSKTVIITGATSGIGLATVKQLLTKNIFENFALIGRNIESLDCLNNNNKKIKIYKFSLDDIDSIPNLIKNIYNDFGAIDCLLNIAGYTEPASLLETTKDNLLQTFTINVFAPTILMRECVKYLKYSRNPKILNVASTAGITPRPGWMSYASSKAAIVSISSTLSQELAEYGIKVYCISPGRCATKLRKKLAPEEEQTKIMQPDDVAKIISELIDDNEMFLDGQNIIIRKK